MARLSSGFVIAGAYADKIRRTMFAQLRDYIKRDKEWGQKIALAVAQLNRLLYSVLVEQLKIDKGDVVRVRIEYDIDEAGKNIVWRWDTLAVEVFRRISQEQVDSIVKQVTAKAYEVALAAVTYDVSKLGETFDGDIVFSIKLGEREVGAAIITTFNESLAVLKRGAVVEPTPAIFEKVRLEIQPGKSIEDSLKSALSLVMQAARHVGYDEALKIMNAIRERVAAAPVEKIEEEEEE
ncbi:DUF2258 domain-containing protein [Ignisphaera sp. 4213-co]|uniref:DUF2258 domain-containing protein n=1 Tax=Ignisphaera cupida TaxID=3050454 RepID=A0ABD4Z3Z5_9CREN|nr:DUF2258 domain-containing protein [Ignisphaera sp. 4213-co]MDK6028042.1 DUF2258 domain-containing protein [Ignisphaera sp. 4213-co]